VGLCQGLCLEHGSCGYVGPAGCCARVCGWGCSWGWPTLFLAQTAAVAFACVLSCRLLKAPAEDGDAADAADADAADAVGAARRGMRRPGKPSSGGGGKVRACIHAPTTRACALRTCLWTHPHIHEAITQSYRTELSSTAQSLPLCLHPQTT